MPELDPFDVRLAQTVRRLADCADTRVDALSTATLAMGRRRGGWLDWRTHPARLAASVAVAVTIVALLAYTGRLGVPIQFSQVAGPPSTAGATPSSTPSAVPTPTPITTPDAAGWSTFTGTEQFVVVSPGTDDGAGHLRGIEIRTTDTTSDRRASGTGTSLLNIDASADLGVEWGTYELTNEGGTWRGSCRGSSQSAGNASDITCWLAGSGGYSGLTYYFAVRTSGTTAEIFGFIYAGAPPAA